MHAQGLYLGFSQVLGDKWGRQEHCPQSAGQTNTKQRSRQQTLLEALSWMTLSVANSGESCCGSPGISGREPDMWVSAVARRFSTSSDHEAPRLTALF